MNTLDIVLLVGVPLLIAIPLTIALVIWYKHKRLNNEFYGHFKDVALTVIPIKYWDMSNTPNMQDRVSLAFNLAHQKLRSIYEDKVIVDTLKNINIQIMPTDAWEFEGQKVAGLSHLDLNVVAVGPKLEALCHELIHFMEDRVEGKVSYTHESWNFIKFKACNDYIVELPTFTGEQT